MKYYTLENIELLNNRLYDIFYPMLKYNHNVILYEYVVDISKEMRMDLISIDIYGSSIYVDELMHINDIIDPYSIKMGDKLYFTKPTDLSKYRNSYSIDKKTLLNNTKSKHNLNIDLPISSPIGYNQILYDNKNKSIKITNKLK